jgi:hypothetical protein
VIADVDHHPEDGGTYYPYTAQDQGEFQPQISYFFIHTPKILPVVSFKIKCFLRRKASPSIDKCGAKPRIFSQNQSQRQSQRLLTLTLQLTENAGV